MSAERKSRDHSLLAGPLGLLTRIVLRVPRAVLVIALALAALSLLVTFFGLGFHTNRLDLLNPRSAYNQRWLAYLDEFGQEDDAVLIFEGPDRPAVVAAIDSMAEALKGHPDIFPSVLNRIDVAPLRSKALHYLSPSDLERVRQVILRLGPVISGNWAHLELSTVLQDWSRQVAQLQQAPRSELVDTQLSQLALQLDRLLAGCNAAIRGHAVASSQLVPTLIETPENPLNQLGGNHDGYLMLDNGRTGLMLTRLAKPAENQMAPGKWAIGELRRIIGEQRTQHPEISIGLTGLPILENDEMQTSQSDMLVASLISFVGVACLFVAGFGGFRLPLLTVATLLIAMAWSFGYVTLGVGHLNILSISFGVILIGLGVDFGIHYVARYSHLRSGGDPCETALVRTCSNVGPGILTGGVTTALAFFSAALTQFTGVAELGIVAGGGILLCVVAAFTVLPALVRLTERRTTIWREPRPLPFWILSVPASWAPRLMLVASAAVTLVLAAGVTRLTFDHNLLHLQAEGLESVAWEHRLLESGERSVWFAVSMAATSEDLYRKKQAFEQLASVQRTEEILSLLPAADDRKSAAITEIRQLLGGLPEEVPLLPVAPQGILLAALEQTASVIEAGPEVFARVRPLLNDFRSSISQENWAGSARRLSAFQQQLAEAVLGQLHVLHEVANPDAPLADDLPVALLDRFVGRSGRHLLRVYARGDIWDMDALSRFVHDVESVDAQITGHPIQTYYASRQMQQSYVHAAIYALLAVGIVLMLDFRSVRFSLLAMFPMACGMVQMFGLLGWMGIPLNPANLIVLPLILGIGIDDGVHVMHDYLQGSGRYRVGKSPVAAIVLTSATTMVGFGSMMIAKHQGLQSLGQVLTLGVACCLVMSLWSLPAMLAIMSSRAAEVAESPSGPDLPDRQAPRPTQELRRPRRRSQTSSISADRPL